jgi:hypothetical protein
MVGSRIRDIVPEVVAACAPAETVIVDGLLDLDDDAIVRRLEGRRRDPEDPLGYGAADVAVLVTPVLWLTLEKVREKLAEVAADGAARGAGAVLRKVLHRKTPPHTVPPLHPGQKAMVLEMVVAAVVAAGLDDALAVRIGDGVVRRLALAEPDPDAAPGAGRHAARHADPEPRGQAPRP